MTKTSFTPYDQVQSVFEQVLAASPADETELVWFERQYGSAASGGGAARRAVSDPRLTVLVRVIEGGRQGWHRTDAARANELESGLRQALALAKVQPKVKKRPMLPTDKKELRFSHELLDSEVARLDEKSAGSLVSGWCGKDLEGRLDWSETRLAIFNNHGLKRSAATSELTFEATRGEGPGSGRAAGSARSLEALGAEAICERARRDSGHAVPLADLPLADLPAGPIPVLLTPEAVASLLNVLSIFAFAGRAYLEGTSFLVRHRNVQVFDRAFNLRDDGGRVPGLPFPFDLEGSPKHPLDLIVEGQPSTLALNLVQGAEAGMRPTAQAVGGHDALFGNLFMLPGTASQENLLAAAEGGIRIGWLDPPECFEPLQLRIRARARCVRRIEGGRLGAALPDFVWEESLLRALARLLAIGGDPVALSMPTTPLGAISAPSLVLADAEGFHSI
ncbi:MAG: hypothetical protein GY719_03205 [bacterium]|nr:hypothetical protein [bacterium]